MAVPKRRTSPSKQKMRRAANVKIVVPNLIPCPACGEAMIPHRVCPKCGKYKGKQVTPVTGGEETGSE